MDSEWRPIETAPRDPEEVIWLKAWHGIHYLEVRARWNDYHNGWLDERENSCVAYIVGGKWSIKHPAYWKPLKEQP